MYRIMPTVGLGWDHLTSLRFYCAANVVTASEAREPDAYRVSSNRLLDGAAKTCDPRDLVTQSDRKAE